MITKQKYILLIYIINFIKYIFIFYKMMSKKYIYSIIPIGEKSMCATYDFNLKPVRMNDESIIIYDGFTVEGIEDFKAFQGLEIFINNRLIIRFGFIEFYDIKFINSIIGGDYIIINNYVDNITFRFRRNFKECDIRGLKISYNEHTRDDETHIIKNINETLESIEKGINPEFNWIDIYNHYIKYDDYLSVCWPDRNVISIATNENNDKKHSSLDSKECKKLKHVFMIKTPEGLEENDYKFSIGLDDNLTLSELNKIILKGIYDVNHISITFDKDKLNMKDNRCYFILLCKYN